MRLLSYFLKWRKPLKPVSRPRRCFVPGIERLEDRIVPATFTVTTTLDAVNALDGKLSLREAISARLTANPGADTIVLPAGIYRLALAGADNTNAAGDLDVIGSTVFQGAGAGATVIDGQKLDRVFDVFGTAPHSINVAFQGLTIRNGLADSRGGGGIRVGNADLTVQDCMKSPPMRDVRGWRRAHLQLQREPGTAEVSRSSAPPSAATSPAGSAARP